MSRKQTQRRRGVFNVVIKAPLQGVRIDLSVHAFTAQRAPSVPPGPTNQSTFLINCIQIGPRLLERASEKTCFPARLSSARCYFCLGTKAHYPHTTCALSKGKTPNKKESNFCLCVPASIHSGKHVFQLKGAIWCVRRVNWTLLRNVREADNSCCRSPQRRLLVVGGLGGDRDVFLHRREPRRLFAHFRIFFASSNQSTFLTQPP